MEDLLERLMAELGEVASQPLTATTQPAVQAAIDRAFKDGATYPFAEGAKVVGVSLRVYEDWPDGNGLLCQTAFDPAPRFQESRPHLNALGFYDCYDLYLMEGRNEPPSVVARFGDGPDEYHQVNPGVSGWNQLLEHRALEDAVWRAGMLGDWWREPIDLAEIIDQPSL